LFVIAQDVRNIAICLIACAMCDKAEKREQQDSVGSFWLQAVTS
jgi:hypothetical protein